MEEPEYDSAAIGLLEHVWGDGYLSPGGSEEVDLIIGDVSLSGKNVLDLGCGTGGITKYLASKHKLQSIVGFDVESPGHEKAKQLLSEINTDESSDMSFVLGKPGPLPFEDHTFDVVFTKDALIHVEDLNFTLDEIHRILRPSGIFLGSDWMASKEGQNSSDMQKYLESEGFEFAPKTMEEYRASMSSSHFHSIKTANRNSWHKQQVQHEIEHIGRDHHEELVRKFGKDFIDEQLVAWANLSVVAQSGELFPAHFYAEKV